MKGVLSLVSETRRVIVQGVYELFEKERSTEWGEEPRINRLVFIGTNIIIIIIVYKYIYYIMYVHVAG